MKEKNYTDFIGRQKNQIEDFKSELNCYKARLENHYNDRDFLNN